MDVAENGRVVTCNIVADRVSNGKGKNDDNAQGKNDGGSENECYSRKKSGAEVVKKTVRKVPNRTHSKRASTKNAAAKAVKSQAKKSASKRLPFSKGECGVPYSRCWQGHRY